MGLSASPGRAFAQAPALSRAPLTQPLALLLLLLLLPGPTFSAQFNASWLDSVQGKVTSVLRGRYSDILFTRFRRPWPLGNSAVHHVVPASAMRACLALISSLDTEDLEPAAAEMQAFVDALPTTPVNVQDLVLREQDDETSTLEILVTAIQWNPGNTVTGPPSDKRWPSDPGDKFEQDIVDALLEGGKSQPNDNATEVAKGKQLEQYNSVVRECRKTSSSSALAHLTAFFKMNTELVDTHGVTQVPDMPYLDNMVGWRYSSVPGHTDDFEPCALSNCAT